jgi:distribution and morphology protein 34
MAFNFNWSPLIADTSRAREMLTTALNKSPKPPIIVDDIIVTELNLGTTPPELEILEVGDLAEDRFRGIFKMSYTGDAFLTLKTKVQANPLNTYLSTKPSFASPEPLAAAAGLTIPLQITLSDIRLSGFVILVFSKQKGLTLVFRNDPLESLKVSSTFDSIPFVRDYLQKEIEGQLRVLFMEDLPAIIHRLSLRLWSPEYQELEFEERMDNIQDTTVPVDPLATNPPDAVDAFGNPLEQTPSSTLTLDTASEIHASFSRKNILRLAALSESQRTLSLFTPGIRDAVFRAWAGHAEQPTFGAATPALTLSSLSRIHSTFNSVKSNSSSVASGSTGNETHSSRPTVSSSYSASAGLSLGANKSRTHPMRKRKKRVINLRKDGDGAESSGVSTEATTPASSPMASEASVISEDVEQDDPVTTPKSSRNPAVWSEEEQARMEAGEPGRLSEKTAFSEGLLPPAPILSEPPRTSKAKQRFESRNTPFSDFEKRPSSSRPPLSQNRLRSTQQASSPLLRSLSFDKVPSLSSTAKNPVPQHAYSENVTSSSGGILEQAWMLKMAQEIARKVHEEKNRDAAGRGLASSADLHHAQPRGSKATDAAAWATGDEPMDAPPAYHA